MAKTKNDERAEIAAENKANHSGDSPPAEGSLFNASQEVAESIDQEQVATQHAPGTISFVDASWRDLLQLKLKGQIGDIALINLLLPRITRDIGSIKKGRQATGGIRFNFRGIDDALNAISPILTAYGCRCEVYCANQSLERYEKPPKGDGPGGFEYHATLEMTVRFIAPDGSSSTNTTIGEGSDMTGSDKATNKAMSAAMKYAMFFGLLVPVHADAIEDPDAEGNESEMVRTARKLIRQARDPAAVERVRKRVDASKAFDEEEKMTLTLLLDDKQDQINS